MANGEVVTMQRLDRNVGVLSKSSHSRVMALLRAQTAPLHFEFEQKLDLFTRVNTLIDYRQLLGRFYGFYSPLERVLWRALAPLKQELMLDKRRKAPLISADLSVCGLSDGAIVELPRWQQIAPFPSISQALGQLYVLEGTTLGGQVSTRHFRRLLALKNTAGLSFFYSYGLDVPQRWRQFCAVVSDHVRTPAQEDLMVNAAIDTLEMLRSWMIGKEGH